MFGQFIPRISAFCKSSRVCLEGYAHGKPPYAFTASRKQALAVPTQTSFNAALETPPKKEALRIN